MNYTPPKVRLSKALAAFDGDRKALAEYLGITPEAIMNWQRQGFRFLPEMRALQIVQTMPELAEGAAA